MHMARQFRVLTVFALAVAVVPAMAAPQQWKNALKKAGQAVKQQSQEHGKSNASGVSNSEAAAGLKQALAKGTTHAIDVLGKKNGFWDNKQVRIPLPGVLEKLAKVARATGQGGKVDAFELSMNRAAEKAVPEVADILGDAIQKMTLNDAIGILTGGDHAATDYFRRVAGEKLTQRIEPIVSKATDSVGVTHKYKALLAGSQGSALSAAMDKLGGGSGAKSLNLDQYVTGKTIDGLFTEIGDQEKAIRENPAARTTDLLRKVFSHQ